MGDFEGLAVDAARRYGVGRRPSGNGGRLFGGVWHEIGLSGRLPETINPAVISCSSGKRELPTRPSFPKPVNEQNHNLPRANC